MAWAPASCLCGVLDADSTALAFGSYGRFLADSLTSGDYFGVAIVGIGSDFGLGGTSSLNMSSGLSSTSKLELRWMTMA
jgi:hypothetical protein